MPFGQTLQSMVLPDYLQHRPDVTLPSLVPNIPPPAAPQPQGMSKGQLILGVLADALAGAQGRPGQFAAQMGQQRQEQREDVRWQRDRQARLEDYGEQQRMQQQYAPPSPMLRDADAWARMTDAQRAAYGQMQEARRGDPDVFVTLPNGQVYAGPKSGLAQALTGQGAAAPVPQAPVGRLTPIQGGQTARPSGTFRP